ncbi:MAG: S-layer homology domain-containing protein [Thermoleophilia bacterium]|jgi:hypothetical protein
MKQGNAVRRWRCGLEQHWYVSMNGICLSAFAFLVAVLMFFGHPVFSEAAPAATEGTWTARMLSISSSYYDIENDDLQVKDGYVLWRRAFFSRASMSSDTPGAPGGPRDQGLFLYSTLNGRVLRLGDAQTTAFARLHENGYVSWDCWGVGPAVFNPASGSITTYETDGQIEDLRGDTAVISRVSTSDPAVSDSRTTIHLFDLSSGSDTKISSDEWRVDDISCNERYVVWMGKTGTYGVDLQVEVFAYDRISKITQRMTTDGGNKGSLRLGGDYVAWTDYDPPVDRPLRVCDLSTGEVWTISEDAYLLGMSEYGVLRTADTSPSAGVCLYDPRVRQERVLPVIGTNPTMSGWQVAWVEGEDAQARVGILDLRDDSQAQVAAGWARRLVVDEGMVAWSPGHICLATPFPLPTGFLDTDSSPYTEAIGELSRLSMIEGRGGGIFGPDDPVLRAQLAKMVVTAAELLVSPDTGGHSFTDVHETPDSLYPNGYISVAANSGLVKGYPDGSFRPYTNITRAQLLTVAVRSAHKQEEWCGTFLKTPPATWRGVLPGNDATHGKNIRQAEYNGLLAGIDLKRFDIYGTATRGEIAQILWNIRAACMQGTWE